MTSRLPDGRDFAQERIKEVKQAHDLAKKVLEHFDLDWEVEYDDYDPGQYPGIRVEAPNGYLFATLNYDFYDQHEDDWSWRVCAWISEGPNSPPEPSTELQDGLALSPHQGVADVIGTLVREEARVYIDDLCITDPNFSIEG